MSPPLIPSLTTLTLSFTGVAINPAVAQLAPPDANASSSDAGDDEVVPTPPPTAAPTTSDRATVAPPAASTDEPPPAAEDNAIEDNEIDAIIAERAAARERANPTTATSSTSASLLRSTDKRFFFTLFAGGAKTFRGPSVSYFSAMDFKIEGAIGGHGKNSDFGGAFVLQAQSGFPVRAFTFAPRVQWDKPLTHKYAIYMTTTALLGYRMITPSYGTFVQAVSDGALYHAGVLAIGWGATAIVAERLLLSFRPVNFEVAISNLEGVVMLNWDVLGGLGVVW